ncbi:hypothetical protein TPSD3_06215 [Thioflexithrix psekupsensis]|uniref:GmrSD restriction endonucleases N-terminal domain-containing protein n=2 Tax=Thioflexithrix psekupsensis TaxID=1570016 RepID=A0A251XA86_9GAMM|nr:hypothetical protein TPSD3_06215 [Thioflexithrix psekupsensis]
MQRVKQSKQDIELEEILSGDPFNPDDISIKSKVIAMETILRRLVQNTINLNPDFQRREVWEEDKKSQLIESLMLKIPLPMFYVSEDEKGYLTVIDGLQRLSTLRDFILGGRFLKDRKEIDKGNGFPLFRLEFWKDFNGKTFNELPINLQNRILETEFNFTIIEPNTPEEVKRNIFKRINTGGEPLSAQEIRNALYIGYSTKLLNELAAYSEFEQATGFSVKTERMEDKELILRFLAFWVRDYTDFKKAISVDTFLSNTMIIINAYPDFNNRDFKKLLRENNLPYLEKVDNLKNLNIQIENVENIRSAFKSAMVRAYRLFDKHTFRRSYGENPRKPINKALFEMWSVSLSKLTEQQFYQLLDHKQQLHNEYNLLLEDIDFQFYISRDALKVPAVKERFSKIINLIEKFIQ